MFLAIVDWHRVFNEAGWLAYILAACFTAAIFIIIERGYALRNAGIIPADLADAIMEGKPTTGGRHSAAGRIMDFVERHPGDSEGSKAYARLEIMKMERGVSYLDVCFTPRGRTFIAGTAGALTPMSGVATVNVNRGTTSIQRTVAIPPSGIARVAL